MGVAALGRAGQARGRDLEPNGKPRRQPRAVRHDDQHVLLALMQVEDDREVPLCDRTAPRAPTAAVLPGVATACADAPDREFDPTKPSPIDDRDDASVCRSKPRLGVSKRPEKGNAKSE